MSLDSTMTLFTYKCSRLAYRLFRIHLRVLLGKHRREPFLARIWIAAFDLPSFIPTPIRRPYQRKCLSVLVPKWYEEVKVSEYLSKISGELYVDVGSSFGHYPRKLSPNFKRILAIEADPRVFTYLCEYMPPNCQAINVAITDTSGVAEFHSPIGQINFGIGSLLSAAERSTWIKPISYHHFIVRTTTLNELLANEEHIDLVKVDVEGAEAKVLRGTSAIITKVARWMIEIHNPKERSEITRMLTNHGYRVKAIDDRHYAFERYQIPT